MGYLVPDSKLQMNYVMENELADAFTSVAMADNMRKLVNAYHEDAENFNEHADEYFNILVNVFQEFDIEPDKHENGLFADSDELFPQEKRNQETFKETFYKLWKSISIVEDFKKSEEPSLKSIATVANIYGNYEPVYDRILMEKDMHTNLERTLNGYVPTSIHSNALRTLYLISDKHKAGEPFTDKEKDIIGSEAYKLNSQFAKYDRHTRIDNGLFFGESIKTLEDLRNYIDSYETMLRDRMNKEAKDYYKFAQEYKFDNSEGHVFGGLTEDDVTTMNKKLDKVLNEEDLKAQRKVLSEEMDPIFKDLDSVLDELKDLDRAVKVYGKQVLDAHDAELSKAFKDITDEPEAKKAKEAYDQALTSVKNDLEEIENYSHARNVPRGIFRRNDGFDMNKIHTTYSKKVQSEEDAVAFYNTDVKAFTELYGAERTSAKEKSDAAKKVFKKTILNQADGSISKYNKEVQQKLDEINKKHEELKKDPYNLQYKKDLKDLIDALKTDVGTHIEDFNREITVAENKLKETIAPYKTACKRESDYKRTRLMTATLGLKEIRDNLKKDYQKTDLATKIKDSKNQNIKNELGNICEAMKSVKKISLLGNSPKYKAMMAAIKGYRENKVDANEAYDACKAYLNASLTDGGGLKNMDSKAGKIRKQSCVRMMELLEGAPDFYNLDEIEEKVELAADKEEKKEVYKDKLNYETLKASLASKSAEVTVNSKSKDAKAYSNLNEKLKKIRDTKNAAAAKAAAKKSDSGKKAQVKKDDIKKKSPVKKDVLSK